MSHAADHRDWPGYQNEIAADITDVYAWMSTDRAKVYLALDIQGANTGATATTKFSDSVQYVFHLNSTATYAPGMPGNKPDTIICKFDSGTPQNFECWGPGATGAAVEYVKDAVGNTAGKSSTSGKMKVFAGLRDDPFFFNIRGFLQAANTVKGAAGSLTFTNGCPALDMATTTALGNQLGGGGAMGVAPADDFGRNGNSLLPPGGGMTNGNILAIVIAIDTSLLTGGGSLVSVWASTRR